MFFCFFRLLATKDANLPLVTLKIKVKSYETQLAPQPLVQPLVEASLASNEEGVIDGKNLEGKEKEGKGNNGDNDMNINRNSTGDEGDKSGINIPTFPSTQPLQIQSQQQSLQPSLPTTIPSPQQQQPQKQLQQQSFLTQTEEAEYLVITGLMGGEAKRLACNQETRHLKLGM